MDKSIIKIVIIVMIIYIMLFVVSACLVIHYAGFIMQSQIKSEQSDQINQGNGTGVSYSSYFAK